tara:strand:- start:86491 stop:88356 length:1866 start_codon:yes stop_codon:yes gene_type:complete
MCGICGFIGEPTSPDKAHRALRLIAHRGPDAQDHYLIEDVFLGHARLAIIDLSNAANQPMVSEDNRYIIIYNGEIYNFKELRKELINFGLTFKTSSDTEVIVNGFSIWGNDIFSKLNGVFGLAIWDKVKKELTLARDRFGVKPLYYSSQDGKLAFGSEIKTILEFLPSNLTNHQAFREFLDYGNPLGVQTMFEGIKELSPGTILTFSKKEIREIRFWDINSLEPIIVEDEEAIQRTSHALENAVKRQLVSDVPVGVFLSGGIDSSLVTAYASKHIEGSKLSTFTAAFDFDIGINELESARRVANHFGTNHHELFIEGKNLEQTVADLIVHHDAPFSDAANIPLYLLTKQLDSSVKVILQGDGGDEFFAGYRRYQLLEKYGSGINRSFFRVLKLANDSVMPIPSRVRRMISAFGSKDDIELMALLLTVDTKQRSAFNSLNEDVKKRLELYDPYQWYRELDNISPAETLVQRMLYLDTQTILPRTFLEKVDKSTMANSIEVRVPLLDNELTDFVLRLPSHQKIRDGEKKWLLKKALRGVVPDFVLDGKKTGFGVPYENWIKGPLYEMFSDTVHSSSFTSLGIFDYKTVNQYMTEHKNGTYNNGFILWKIFQFGLWADKYKMSF